MGAWRGKSRRPVAKEQFVSQDCEHLKKRLVPGVVKDRVFVVYSIVEKYILNDPSKKNLLCGEMR